ncbi:MAG: response regulator transcription factor, partial [Verrucomicrobiota bacterium]
MSETVPVRILVLVKTAAAHPIVQVWLVEDHEDCRRMVVRAINRASVLRCPHAFSSCEQALSALEREPAPDVILLDVGLPGMDGIQGIREIKRRAPSVQVIMLTVYDDHQKVFDAICAGASGYLLKTDDDEGIVQAIQEVLRGGAPMNPR